MRLEHHLCRAWRVDAFNGEFPHCERLLQIWKRLLQEGHQARLRGKTLVLWTRASITGHLFQIMILSTWGDELSSFCNLVVKSSGSTRPSIRPFTERSIRTSFKYIAICVYQGPVIYLSFKQSTPGHAIPLQNIDINFLCNKRVYVIL